MQRNKNSIPDLRKKTEDLNYLNFHRYFDLQSCLFIGLIVVILIFSIISVAALPNSNFPASI
ncbi:MAG: hypothetical protein LUQ24_04425 [Methanobacterium sp.]|jgi:hypothetical protein|nr:hypothetical protein [Methanobacterium sp.]